MGCGGEAEERVWFGQQNVLLAPFTESETFQRRRRGREKGRVAGRRKNSLRRKWRSSG